MYAIGLLWLPIVLSAVAAFIISCIVHMATRWHAGDFRKLPDEDAVMRALRPFGIPPGDYMAPRPSGMSDMKSPEYQAKRREGPVFMMTMYPSGDMGMGAFMVQWFVYLLVISALVGLLAGATVGAGTTDHRRFHVVALTAWLAYSAGIWPLSIWYRRSWTTTFKSTVDGLLYALATGAIFVWMWPR